MPLVTSSVLVPSILYSEVSWSKVTTTCRHSKLVYKFNRDVWDIFVKQTYSSCLKHLIPVKCPNSVSHVSFNSRLRSMLASSAQLSHQGPRRVFNTRCPMCYIYIAYSWWSFLIPFWSWTWRLKGLTIWIYLFWGKSCISWFFWCLTRLALIASFRLVASCCFPD